jgi:hypothetical protein
VQFTGSGSTAISVTPQFSCGSGSTSGINVNVVPNITPSLNLTAGNLQLCSGQSATITAFGTNLGSTINGQYYSNNIPGAVTSNNTYTLTPTNNETVYAIITTSGGCFTSNVAISNTLTFSVNGSQTPNVQITVTAGSPSGCTADFIGFTALSTAAGSSPTYQWKNGNTNVGSGATTFGGSNIGSGSQITVVLTSSLSCATQPTATSNVITLNTTATGIAPCVPPVITTITGATSVNANQTVVYSVPLLTGATYNWTVPAGATITSGNNTNSITVDFGSTGGNISVSVTNNYGTGNTFDLPVSIIVTDLVDNQYSFNQISLYPNPSNSSFNLNLGQSGLNEVSVEITDIKGSLVYQDQNSNGSNLGNGLPAGSYIVSIIAPNGVKRLKFVKTE